MKASFKIISEEVRNRAIEILRNLTLDPIHEIKITEYHRNRSAEQNRIMWQWLTVIGNELGEDKNVLHERYKDGYLVQIYERDNEDYAEMVQSLRVVWTNGMKKEAVFLRKKMVSLTSTTTATVPQMQEYLTEIERHATSLGIRLPHPEDN